LNRGQSALPSNLLKRFPFVFGVGRAGHDQDAIRPSDVFETLGDGRRIIMSAAGYQDRDRRSPCLIGIGVGRDIQSLATRALNPSDDLAGFPPDAHGR